jgi:hypothetical protein
MLQPEVTGVILWDPNYAPDFFERAEPRSPQGHMKLKRHLLLFISRGLLEKSESSMCTDNEGFKRSIRTCSVGDEENR